MISPSALLEKSSFWSGSGSWVKLWWEVHGLGLIFSGSGTGFLLLCGSWVLGNLGGSDGCLTSLFLLTSFLSCLLRSVSSDASISILLESDNLWVNSSIGNTLLEVLLLSLVNEESLLVVFLGILD